MPRDRMPTKTQMQVLWCIVEGCTAKEGAARLRMNPMTYRTHAQSLHILVNARTNAGVVAIAFRRGWVC